MEAVWLQPARALAAADHRGGGYRARPSDCSPAVRPVQNTR
ncbi:MAG TPA: hypothetical protein VFV88_04660 [Steroidobacteraceae bacterium]|nr:hypothetical protein [Steroidobacteraceae bacterium]